MVGTEPLLYAATSPDVVNGGYYGPRGFMELFGHSTLVRPTRKALDAEAAARLWAVAEQADRGGASGERGLAETPALRIDDLQRPAADKESDQEQSCGGNRISWTRMAVEESLWLLRIAKNLYS